MRKIGLIVFSLTLLNLLAVIISFAFGSTGFSFQESAGCIASVLGFKGYVVSDELKVILLQVRLPRILLASCAGGGLALAGVVFQILVRNILADPYILGVSSGASFGALLAIVTGLERTIAFALPLSAFLGAILVVLIVYSFGRGRALANTSTLLLTGVMTSAFLSAGIVAVIAVNGDPMRDVLFWLIGYLGHATPASAAYVLTMVVLLGSVIALMSARLNILSLGSETAQSMGLDVRFSMILFYFLASLLTASIVAFTGPIGFVGLVIPHVTRIFFGSDNRVVVPGAFFIGSLFLIFCDLISRWILFPQELPVGAVTSAIGAPVFLYLLKKRG